MSELPQGGWEIPDMKINAEKLIMTALVLTAAIAVFALGGEEMATSILTLIGL